MSKVDFDRMARIYHPLERIVFGRVLQRARCAFLDALPQEGEVLLLGDGDGRYLEAALRASRGSEFVSLDSSRAMLKVAEARLSPEERERVVFVHASVEEWLALNSTPEAGRFDAVVTHFFLDCFSDGELQELVPRIASLLRPGGSWVVAEFRRPAEPWWWRLGGGGLITAMYGFFRVAAGLRVGRLPDHRRAFRRAGLVSDSGGGRMGWRGLVGSELWRVPA